MIRKLRVLVAALLLVPALYSNANAFTTESDGVLNPARPPAAVCYFYWSGMWIVFEC
jgi:hypothetical protein